MASADGSRNRLTTEEGLADKLRKKREVCEEYESAPAVSVADCTAGTSQSAGYATLGVYESTPRASEADAIASPNARRGKDARSSGRASSVASISANYLEKLPLASRAAASVSASEVMDNCEASSSHALATACENDGDVVHQDEVAASLSTGIDSDSAVGTSQSGSMDEPASLYDLTSANRRFSAPCVTSGAEAAQEPSPQRRASDSALKLPLSPELFPILGASEPATFDLAKDDTPRRDAISSGEMGFGDASFDLAKDDTPPYRVLGDDTPPYRDFGGYKLVVDRLRVTDLIALWSPQGPSRGPLRIYMEIILGKLAHRTSGRDVVSGTSGGVVDFAGERAIFPYLAEPDITVKVHGLNTASGDILVGEVTLPLGTDVEDRHPRNTVLPIMRDSELTGSVLMTLLLTLTPAASRPAGNESGPLPIFAVDAALHQRCGYGTCKRQDATIIIVTEEGSGNCWFYPYATVEEADVYFKRWRLTSRIMFLSRNGFILEEIRRGGVPFPFPTILKAAQTLRERIEAPEYYGLT